MTRPTDDQLRLGLLGSFEVRCHGVEIRLPRGTQRLLAALALRDGVVHRTNAAELLWPDSPRGRAMANLRSAVWKGRRISGLTVIECDAQRLRLTREAKVDHSTMMVHARRIAHSGDRTDLLGSGEGIVEGLSRGLLPDWLDDWLLVDRERWDQVRLHALETLACRLLAAEHHLAALEAALAAVAIEPVRESAHRTVVEIYLAEGNPACALQHFQRYRRLVQLELGVAPSSRMTQLIQPIAS
jgi:DNA-binding SARP family transcriptional activator